MIIQRNKIKYDVLHIYGTMHYDLYEKQGKNWVLIGSPWGHSEKMALDSFLRNNQ